MAGATIGAVVVDVATGEVLWSHDAERPLSLASVQKVLTATAALDRLGPDFRWRTTVYGQDFDAATGVVRGDLIVRGRGDPTLTAADLAALVRDLRWRGVTRIAGDLTVDASYFDGVDEPPRYDDQPRERAGYRAPIAATSLERNAVTVVVTADRANLGLADVTLDPPGGDYVRVVQREVVTVTTGRTRVTAATVLRRDHLELKVTGQINAADGVTFVRRRIDDPAALFGEGLRTALAAAGIRVRGRGIVRRPADTYPDAVVLAEHSSAPLAEVIRTMAKYSDNFIAETVLKTLGAETRATTGPGTWADGVWALQETLTAAGVPAGTARTENGSGLYDATAVSARAVAQVLVAGWRNFRIGPELASALAIGGVDGTLGRRLTGADVRGRIRGKTGTLAAVASLAGYAGLDSTHPLAFVCVVNGLPSGTRGDAKRLQDRIATVALAFSAP
ncbi:MAG: D-alanyl-D-alanine carboxypeptidase/D-alanyl-D-alanine-endopeptidase [Kofleriaceae bacterium]